MNFLAHIYLSFGDQDLALGNFIADHVRGKSYTQFPEPVQKGILLHRAIDTFTDSHPIARSSSKRLHPRHHHYSRVIVDIYYDHFLAKNWERYAETPLKDFTSDFYTLLHNRFDLLPVGIQRFLPYMVNDDWLYSYGAIEGIDQVLKGMNRRVGYRSRMDEAVEDLQEHYEKFESEFHSFFKELIIFSRQHIETL